MLDFVWDSGVGSIDSFLALMWFSGFYFLVLFSRFPETIPKSSEGECCEKKVVSGDDKEIKCWKMQGGIFVGSLQIERQVRECLSVLCFPFSPPPSVSRGVGKSWNPE